MRFLRIQIVEGDLQAMPHLDERPQFCAAVELNTDACDLHRALLSAFAAMNPLLSRRCTVLQQAPAKEINLAAAPVALQSHWADIGGLEGRGIVTGHHGLPPEFFREGKR